MSGRAPSPHGSARAWFERAVSEPSSLDDVAALFAALRNAAASRDLGVEELFVAEELVRVSRWLSPAQTRALCFAVVAALAMTREGSTRLPIGGGPRGVLGQLLGELIAASGLDLEIGPLLRDVRALVTDNYFGRLFGTSAELRPLVSADGCIYLQRMFDAERALVERARARLDQPTTEAEAKVEVSDGGSFPLSDEQREAVALAMTRPLAVISGGPGTGKTAIASAILRTAYERGMAPESMALAAPTGKAAQRLSDSVGNGLRDASLRARLPGAATLHRLLGYLPGGGFRHHENHPIGAELVIVDEASMIDLALMDRLLAALGPTTRLVLLGDADQLPSVDAGAVLRDFVVAGDRPLSRPRYSARLTHSYRMNPSDPEGRSIYELSRAIGAGDGRAIDAVASAPIDHLPFSAVSAVSDFSPAALDALLTHWIDRLHARRPGFAERCQHTYHIGDDGMVDEHRAILRELVADIESAKVLTATRHQRTGSLAVSERLHALARLRLGSDPHPIGPGEPILVTRNDYRRGLFNGDTGVVIRVFGAGVSEPQLRIAFVRDDEIRLYPPQALRGITELGHAITVHRSQGSEYRDVAVIFPERSIPLLTRELLYTAVTRARSSVTLFGDKALYRGAVRRSVLRFSGIVDRLSEEP